MHLWRHRLVLQMLLVGCRHTTRGRSKTRAGASPHATPKHRAERHRSEATTRRVARGWATPGAMGILGANTIRAILDEEGPAKQARPAHRWYWGGLSIRWGVPSSGWFFLRSGDEIEGLAVRFGRAKNGYRGCLLRTICLDMFGVCCALLCENC